MRQNLKRTLSLLLVLALVLTATPVSYAYGSPFEGRKSKPKANEEESKTEESRTEKSKKEKSNLTRTLSSEKKKTPASEYDAYFYLRKNNTIQEESGSTQYPVEEYFPSLNEGFKGKVKRKNIHESIVEVNNNIISEPSVDEIMTWLKANDKETYKKYLSAYNRKKLKVVWYVIKETSNNTRVHVDGVLVEKSAVKFIYYGNYPNNSDTELKLQTFHTKYSNASVGYNPLNKKYFTPVRDGYRFLGWNTKADASGKWYKNHDNVKLTDDFELYAQWGSDYNFYISGDDTYKVYINDELAKADAYELADKNGSYNQSLTPDIIIEGMTIDPSSSLAHKNNYEKLNKYSYKGKLEKDTFMAIRAQDIDGKHNISGLKAMYKYTDVSGNEAFEGTNDTWYYHIGDPANDSKGREWYKEDYEGSGWLKVNTEISVSKDNNNIAWNTFWPASKDSSGDSLEYIWAPKYSVKHNGSIDTPVYLRSAPPKKPTVDYKVKHVMNDGTLFKIDGFENPEKKTGVVGAKTDAKASDDVLNAGYKLSTTKAIENVDIKSDGTSVATVYYEKDDDKWVKIAFTKGEHGKLDGTQNFEVLKDRTLKSQGVVPPTIKPDYGYAGNNWNPQYNGDNLITTDTVYVAQYVEKTNEWVRVIFKVNDAKRGSLSGQTSFKVKKGTQYDTIKKPTTNAKTGYRFDKWVDEPTGALEKSITITAQFVPEKYVVSYDSKGGNDIPSEKVDFGEKATKPAEPQKAGHIFKGWLLDGKPYDFDTSIIKDIKLEAKWEKAPATVKYTVKYLDENGTAIASEKIASGIVGTSVTETAETVEGYTLQSPSPHSISLDKDSSKNVIEFTYKKDVLKVGYVVKYLDENGNPIAKEKTGLGTIGTDITEEKVTIEGYTFVGTSPRTITLNADKDKNIIVFDYKKNASTNLIQFDTNGGSQNPADQNVPNNGKIKKPADPSKEDHIFDGWELNGKPYDFDDPVTGSVTLVAKWKVNYNVFVSGDDTYKVYINDTEAKSKYYEAEDSKGSSDAKHSDTEFAIEGLKDMVYPKNKRNLAMLNKYLYKGSLKEDTFVAIESHDNTELKTIRPNVAGVKAMYKYTDANGKLAYRGTDKTWYYYTGDEPADDANGKHWYEKDYKSNDWKPVKTIAVGGKHDAKDTIYGKFAGTTFGNAGWNKVWPADKDTLNKNDLMYVWSPKFDFIKNQVSIDTPVYLRSAPPQKIAGKQYTVVFIDHDGTELKRDVVDAGKDATAPKDPSRPGYKFKKWDKPFTKVNEDLRVQAVYEKDPNAIGLDAKGYKGVYDAKSHPATASAIIKDAKITYSIDDGKTWKIEVPAITKVGKQSVKVRAEKTGHKTEEVDVTLEVTPKIVKVTANDAVKDLGAKDPDFTPYVKIAQKIQEGTFPAVKPELLIPAEPTNRKLFETAPLPVGNLHNTH